VADPNYQYASIVLGPIGLGQEIGRGLFGAPKDKPGDGPPASSPGGLLVIIGGIGLLFFAVYMFASRGGAKLFQS
jgi:hypothetical protein